MFDVLTYVAGFAFDDVLQRVVLIEKTKPDWQKGKLNGVGGKVEGSDTSLAYAMEREFQEETSVKVDKDRWKLFSTLNCNTWRVKFFVAKLTPEEMLNLKTTTEETVTVRHFTSIQDIDDRSSLMSNIPWLTQMAYNALTGIENRMLTITESLF
jgi:8-oxo-dGTP diphosphatase